MKTKRTDLAVTYLNWILRTGRARAAGLGLAAVAILSVGVYATVEYGSHITAWSSGGSDLVSNPGLSRKSIVGPRANVAIGDYHRVNEGDIYSAALAVGSAQMFTQGYASLGVGGTNLIRNYWSLAAGYGLIVPAQSGPSGSGYWNGRMPATVLGSYNDTTEHGSEHFLFSVGNGNSSATASNAFTVYKSGAVVVHHPSPEIPMF